MGDWNHVQVGSVGPPTSALSDLIRQGDHLVQYIALTEQEDPIKFALLRGIMLQRTKLALNASLNLSGCKLEQRHYATGAGRQKLVVLGNSIHSRRRESETYTMGQERYG